MLKRKRRGCIYSEEQRNLGRASFRRGVGYVSRTRWVAEISIFGKRHRFRSTNYGNCRRWLDSMIMKYV